MWDFAAESLHLECMKVGWTFESIEGGLGVQRSRIQAGCKGISHAGSAFMWAVRGGQCRTNQALCTIMRGLLTVASQPFILYMLAYMTSWVSICRLLLSILSCVNLSPDPQCCHKAHTQTTLNPHYKTSQKGFHRQIVCPSLIPLLLAAHICLLVCSKMQYLCLVMELLCLLDRSWPLLSRHSSAIWLKLVSEL